MLRDPPLPGIPVGDLLKHRLGFRRLFPTDLGLVAKIRPDGEGWVDVHEFQPTFHLDLPPQRAVGKGREDQLIIAPDQFVVPAGTLVALVVEQRKVAAFAFGFPPRLVDVLYVVEGQDGTGGLLRYGRFRRGIRLLRRRRGGRGLPWGWVGRF